MVTPTPTTVQVKMQLRGDTAANWASVNPVLLAREVGLETDTKKVKVGDGTTAWNSLAYFPSIVSGGTVLGNLEIGTTGTLTFEGSTADGFETTLAVTDPTADRTITLPDQSGTVVVTGNASIVDADIAANAEIAVSKLANGTANQVIVTDGTNVSWSDDLTLAGNLTVNGTTTTVNTETLVVKDKNIEMGVVGTPTDLTADGGGITLKGTTDKTINWIDATDAWTSSERFSVPLGSAASPSLTFTGDENSGVYSPGADQLALSTNGTGRLFIDEAGRIGIGTDLQNATIDALAEGLNIKRTEAGTNNAISLFWEHLNTSTQTEQRIRSYIGDDTTADGYGYGGYLAFGKQDTWAVTAAKSSYFAVATTYANAESEKFRITSTGLVGIGTSSIDRLLHVEHPTENVVARFESGDLNVNIEFADNTTTTAPTIGANGDNLRLGTGGTSAIHIDSSQRVGIGTTTPSAKLDVYLGANNVGTIARFGGYNDGRSLVFSNSGIGNDHTINAQGSGGTITFQTASLDRAKIDSSGRLLVGTSTARSTFDGASPAFQIEGTSQSGGFATIFRNGTSGGNPATLGIGRSRGSTIGSVTALQSNDVIGRTVFFGTDGTGTIMAAEISAVVDGTPGTNDMPGRLVFSTTADGASSPTERMTITSGGTLRFAQSASDTPASDNVRGSSLQSTGAINASNTGAAALVLNRTENDTVNREYARFYRVGSNTIGTISGTLTATFYNTSSDYRLKENVTPVTDGITRLQQLKPSRFNFITDPDKTVDGFLAHEVQTIVPEAITGEKDAVDDDGNPQYQGIDQSKLVPLLTAALQEAIGEIESLKARVAALETP